MFQEKSSNEPLTTWSIAAKCVRTLSSLFSPNLIDQSLCRRGLVLACVVRILHDNWLTSLRENRPDMVLKHLAVMLLHGLHKMYRNLASSFSIACNDKNYLKLNNPLGAWLLLVETH